MNQGVRLRWQSVRTTYVDRFAGLNSVGRQNLATGRSSGTRPAVSAGVLVYLPHMVVRDPATSSGYTMAATLRPKLRTFPIPSFFCFELAAPIHQLGQQALGPLQASLPRCCDAA